MEFALVGPLLEHGVDRFDGSQLWRTTPVLLETGGGEVIPTTCFAYLLEGATAPDVLGMVLYRMGADWSWLHGHECIALADGQRLRPVSDPGLSTEVLDDGGVSEMVTVHWTVPQFAALAGAGRPEARIGLVELDLRMLTASMRALVGVVESL